jgi:diacylglycerol kinase (ATP)
MRVLLLHNPEAGGGAYSRGALMQLLREHGHDPWYRSTKEPGWKRALQRSSDVVAVAGGDGTIAKVLRRLDASMPPVAILPSGSANNIASSLGIGADLGTWVGGWEAARCQRFALPRLRVGEREACFVETVGVGVFSTVIAGAAIDEPRGEAKVAGGVKAFVDALRSAPTHRWRLEIDGEDMAVEGLMLEVLNVPRVGPRLALAPRMQPGAGEVDVVWLPEAGRRDLVDALLAGGPLPHWALQRRRGRSVKLWIDDEPLHVDDEIWVGSAGQAACVHAAGTAVRLLLPG